MPLQKNQPWGHSHCMRPLSQQLLKCMPSPNIHRHALTSTLARPMMPLSPSVESARPHFDVAAPMMRAPSPNVESARPHLNVATPMTPLSAIEPIRTCHTDYSHAMDARHGSNDKRNDERFEELHSRSPPQSKFDALMDAVNIDRRFFPAASEDGRADGNAAKRNNNLQRRRSGGGFNGFCLYKRHAKWKGLKHTNCQFKQEWRGLSDNDREQYNRMARALKNNGQVALRAAPSGKQGRSPCYVVACKIENARK